MKITNAFRSSLVLAGSILFASSLHATNYYWDINGATPGAGGATPSGTWADSSSFWSTDATGSAATSATTTAATDDLFFSAGSDAQGAYTVSLATTQNAGSLTFEEGNVTISGTGGIITLGGTGNIRVNTGLTATIGGNTTTTIDGTAGLSKLGRGTLTLNGSAVNTFTGDLRVNAGTLALNYQNLATPTDLISNGNAVALGGGTLLLTGKNSGTTSQAFNGVTVNAGGGAILGNKNGGTALNIALGSLTTSAAGGSLLLGAGGTGANIPVITTTTNKNAQNIYGGRVVWFNGTANTGYDWATTATASPGPYALSGLATASYTALATGAGTDTANSRITAGATLTGSRTTNSLKIENPAASQTLALGSNLLTLTSGGLLSTGTNATTISGNTGATRLTAGNGSGSYDLVVHQYNSGGLTISAVIGNNGANAVNLVKTGTGNLFLSGANTYTGSTYINQGMLDFTNTTPAGTGRNIFIAPGAIARFNALSNTLLGRLNETTEEIGVFTGGTANSFDLSSSTGANLPNAFLGAWAGNGAKAELSGIITPGGGAYRLGYAGQSGTLGITQNTLLSGDNDLIIGGNRVVIVGAHTFTGTTTIRDGGVLGLAGFTGNTNSMALQNSILDVGTPTATGRVFLEAGTTAGPITGANISGISGTTSATLGGLSGSRNLASAFLFTAPGNNTSATLQGNITGFTLNVGSGKEPLYSGVIADFTAGTTITKTGDGTQVFAGANTYTGATTISDGTLTLANQLAAQYSTVTMNGGTAALQFDSSVAGNAFTVGGLTASAAGTGYNINLENNAGSPAAIALTVGGNNANTTYAGVLSGAGSVTKAGGGMLTLSGANTYTGATTVNAGTLRLDLATGGLSSSSALVMGGGALQLAGTGSQTLSGLTTTATTSSDILLGANQTLTLGGLTSAGANSALNFNTAAGGADASTSTLGTSLVVLTGQTAGPAINSGFTVMDTTGFGLATVNGSDQVVRMTSGLNLLPASGADSSTDYFVDNNAGGDSADGSSSLTLSADQSAKSITVDTTAASGTLTATGFVLSNNIWNFGGVGTNTYGITGGSLNSVAANDSISINNHNAGPVTIASAVVANGTNSVILGGTGTTVLTGTNTYTGTTVLNGGVINAGVAESVDVSGPFGKQLANAAGSIVFGGGTLQYSSANSNDYSGRFSTAANQPIRIDTNGQTVTFGTGLAGSGSTLTKLGAGNLILNAASTYTGATTISGGTLQIGNGGTTGALSATSAIINNGTLAFNRTTITQGTDFGVISGGGSVVLNLGILTLNAANTYGGGTVINGGRLSITADAHLGAATTGVTVNGPATITPANGVYANRNVTINNGATLTFDGGGSTWSGNLTGTGGIAISNTFGSQHTFSGTANTFEGPVQIGLVSGTTGQAYRATFASLADSATANGKISFLASSVTHANGSVFEYNGTSNLEINNRQFEIASSGATPTNGHQIRSNGSGTITVNTNLSVTSTTAQTLSLGGSNTGANAFSTNIANGSSSALSVTKVDTGNWALNGTANSFTGAITFNTTTTSAGTLSYASAAGTNPITFNQTTSTATLKYTGAAPFTMSGLITASALTTGVVTLDASGVTSADTITYSNTASLSTASGGANIRNIVFSGTNTGDNTFAGAIASNTGGGIVIKQGTGKWVLTGNSTYTGATFISNGTLSINSIKNGGTSSAIGAGTLFTLGSGNDNASLIYTGAGDSSNRNVRIGTPNTTPGTGGGSIINNGSGALTFTATTFNNAVTGLTGAANSQNRTLTLGGNYTGGPNEIQGAIVNNTASIGLVNVEKTDASTWVLSGTNSYTGTTTVSGGTLLINGNSSTATGNVDVNAGTLGGIGRIGGAVSVAGGATLAPGASIESLAVASLSMTTGSTFAYEVANNSATGADLLAVGSTLSLTDVTLSLDATTLAALSGGGWNIDDKLTLISYLGGDITSGFTGYLDDTSYFFGANEWLFDYNDTVAGGNYATDAIAAGQNRFVTMTLIPEPSTALLGVLGLLALLRRRRVVL